MLRPSGVGLICDEVTDAAIVCERAECVREFQRLPTRRWKAVAEIEAATRRFVDDSHEVVGIPAADEGSASHLAACEAGPLEFRVGAAHRTDCHAELVGKVAVRRQTLPRCQLADRDLFGQVVGDGPVAGLLPGTAVSLD